MHLVAAELTERVRLTATRRSGTSWRPVDDRPARRLAAPHAVMSSSRSISSAMATNDVGGTAPSSGWSHRASASSPIGVPSARRTIGWNTTWIRSLATASRSATSIAMRVTASSRMVRVEELHAGPAQLLGPVHGEVGVAHELVGVDLDGGDRHADAGADVHLVAVDARSARAHRGGHPLGQGHARPRRRRARR